MLWDNTRPQPHRQLEAGRSDCRFGAPLIALPPFPVAWARQIVPVGRGFAERLRMADGVHTASGARATGKSVRRRGSQVRVLSPEASHRDDGHETEYRPEQDQRNRDDQVPDHASPRFRIAPVSTASEQPRGLPRLGGAVAVPGRSLGNVWVELAFISSSPYLLVSGRHQGGVPSGEALA